MKAHTHEYPMKSLCHVLNVSRAGYYRWKDRPQSNRGQKNTEILERIREIHRKSRQTYGSPRITRALHQERYRCSENRVARLMKAAEIRAKAKRKFTRVVTSTIVRYPASENRVNRVFVAREPNRLWVADITFIRTREGWLYLAAVLDVYSRKIVGWATGPQPTADLAQHALERALGQRCVTPGLVHHSDQGAQYANHQYQKFLQDRGFIASMSRKGNCYDNAMMESFFHTLKMEHVYWNTYRSRRDAETSLFDFIELFYNPERLHSSLGFKSPANFEKKCA
jgi:putative transposase